LVKKKADEKPAYLSITESKPALVKANRNVGVGL
jgi:hypothetical protein